MAPITVLVTEDPFLLSRELEKIRKKSLDSAMADFNSDQFSAREADITDIINASVTLPMMAETRLVIVREAEQFKKDALDALLGYFSKPSPSTHLVLVAAKIDKRLKAWQLANKSGWVNELKAPYANQMPAWIAREAEGRKIAISPQATQALSDTIGPFLMAQVQALEKLELYIHPRKKIELEDVEAMSDGFFSKTVFDFTEKVGERNLKAAERLLDQMMTLGEPLVRLLFLITRHFRLLMLTHEGLSQRISEPEFAKHLGVHPFFVKDYLSQAKKIRPQALRKIYRSLLDTDRALKSSPLDSRLVMDRFLFQVCL